MDHLRHVNDQDLEWLHVRVDVPSPSVKTENRLSFREIRDRLLLSRKQKTFSSPHGLYEVFQGVKLTFRHREVYYESMKRKLKIKPICECRCTGRLQTKRLTRLTHWVVPSVKVYFQQIKKKSKTEGKTCHAKTMLSLEQPIKLL